MQLTVTGKQSMSAMSFGNNVESTRGSMPRQILPHLIEAHAPLRPRCGDTNRA
jgi:hypothetical protein